MSCMVTLVRTPTPQNRHILMLFLKLFRAHSRTYFKETSSLIQKLVALTIETAMITAVTSLVHAILFVVFPKNNLHFLT